MDRLGGSWRQVAAVGAVCVALAIPWMQPAGRVAAGTPPETGQDRPRGSEVLQRRDVQQALLRLARGAISESLHLQPSPRAGRLVPPVGIRAGCFVTLELNGRVRGCRGTLEPFTADLESEIRRNALAASLHDPLYPPLIPRELGRSRISITVVHALVPVGGVAGLSPRDGLVVRAGTKVGVVLPFEGRRPETRLAWGLRKAGLPPGATHDLLRMVATRFIEEGPSQ